MGAPDQQPRPFPPADIPLGAVDRNLDDDGYTGQFRAVAHGQIQCLTCHSTFPADAQRADQLTRLEGASDPDDMLVVIPLVCPVCGTAGRLVAHFGPEASADEAQVLVALRRQPSEGTNGTADDEPTPGVR